MKILMMLFPSLLSQLSAAAQTPDKPLVISHLTGEFYVYTTYGSYKGVPVPSNGMYLVTPKGVALFDTPWDSTQFQPLLDSIKARHNRIVTICISTHFHEDRTAGLEYYRSKGIKTCTTKRTDELSKKRNEKRAEYLVPDDSVYAVGGHTFQTYYAGQGHSPDNIVVWFEQEKILYGGCLVKSTEATDLGNLSDANTREWILTIKNIQNKFKKPAFIIPGHLDWHSNQSLNHTLQLIKDYERKKSS